MRIAVDARPLCVPTFGIGRYTKALLDRLIPQSRHDWFLYADRPLLVDYSSHANVTVRAFPSVNHVLSLPRTQFTFAHWAQQDRVDCFWSPRHHLPLLLPSSVRKVLTIHDLVWRHFPKTMLGRNLFVERLLMPPSVRKADAILCVSGATERDLVDVWPEVESRSTVTPLAADKLDVTPEPVRFFLFVGTLEPRKNLPRLLEAFALAREKGLKDCSLEIAGATGWAEQLEPLLASNPARDHIHLLGRIDDATMHTKMASAIALCLPSLYEGFGLPALEAMQYGTPVIGGNISSIPEVVGEGGLLVDPQDVEAIANAMLKMANDQSFREAASNAARAQSAKFSWDQTAKQTLQILEG